MPTRADLGIYVSQRKEEGNNMRMRRGEERVAYLSFDSIPALLAQIHEIKNRAPQMGHSSDTLHLNRIHLFQRMVQYPRGIDDLPSQILII